jgi:hypothetical protein
VGERFRLSTRLQILVGRFSKLEFIEVRGYVVRTGGDVDPKIGDRVFLKNGQYAEVVGIGSIATNTGLQPTYNLKLGAGPSVNCLREEFTFPAPRNA